MSDIDELCVGVVEAIGTIINPPNDNQNNHLNERTQFLQQSRANPLYIPCLIRTMMNRNLSVHVRRYACIETRNVVVDMWGTNPIPQNIKNELKKIIIQMLTSCENYRLAKSVSNLLFAVAQHEHPHNWPNLLPILMQLFLKFLRSPDTIMKANMIAFSLSLLSETFSQDQLGNLIPLIKIFLNVAGNKEYPDHLRSKCVVFVRNIISVLYPMVEEGEEEGMPFFRTIVEPLLSFITTFVAEVDAQRRINCGFKISVLQLTERVLEFSEFLRPSLLKKILESQCNSLKSEFDLYFQTHIINNNDGEDDDGYDSEGVSVSIRSMIDLSFDCLERTITNFRFINIVDPQHLSVIIELVFKYFQLTREEIREMETNPNTFVEREDDASDSINVRKRGSILLDEIVENYEEKGIKIMLSVFKRVWQDSQRMCDMGNEHWTVVRESALFGLRSIMNLVIADDRFDLIENSGVKISEILTSIYEKILKSGSSHSPSFLQYQAVLTVSSTNLSQQPREQAVKFFQWCFSKISDSSELLHIRIASTRTIVKYLQLYKNFPSGFLDEKVISRILEGFCDLMSKIEYSLKYIILESIKATLNCVDSSSSDFYIDVEVGKRILNFLFDLYKGAFTEVLEIYEINSIFKSFSRNPSLLKFIIQNIFPQLVQGLSEEREDPSYISRMLDMITVIVEGESITNDDVVDVIKQTFVPVLEQSNILDNEAFVSILSYLRLIVESHPQYILKTQISWRNMNNFTLLQIIVDRFILRVLELRRNETIFLELGRLISSVFSHFGDVIDRNNDMKKIIENIIIRINTAQNVSMVGSLVCVFTNLFSKKNNVSQTMYILNLLSTIRVHPDGNGHSNINKEECSGLEFFLNVWCSNNLVSSIGVLERRYCCVAIDHILSTPQLLQIVSNEEVSFQTTNIVDTETRGKRKVWRGTRDISGVKIPFPVRAFIILCENLEYETMITKQKQKQKNWTDIVSYLMRHLGEVEKGDNIRHLRNDRLDMMFFPVDDADDVDADDNDDIYDKFDRRNPLFQLDILDYLSNLIRRLSLEDGRYSQMGMQVGYLGKREKRTLKILLEYKPEKRICEDE